MDPYRASAWQPVYRSGCGCPLRRSGAVSAWPAPRGSVGRSNPAAHDRSHSRPYPGSPGSPWPGSTPARGKAKRVRSNRRLECAEGSRPSPSARFSCSGSGRPTRFAGDRESKRRFRN